MKIILGFISIVVVVGIFPFSHCAEAEACLSVKANKLTIVEQTKCKKGKVALSKLANLVPVGSQGAQGPQGEKGDQGAVGPQGSARAFGFVSSTGNLDLARSSSSASARLLSTGHYCIAASGIAPTSVMPVFSSDYYDGLGGTHLIQFNSGAALCLPGEWEVLTQNFSAGSFALSNFAFSFVIP